MIAAAVLGTVVLTGCGSGPVAGTTVGAGQQRTAATERAAAAQGSGASSEMTTGATGAAAATSRAADGVGGQPFGTVVTAPSAVVTVVGPGVTAVNTAVTGAEPSEVTVAPGATASTEPGMPEAGDDAARKAAPPRLPSEAKTGLAPPGQEPRNELDQPVRLDEAGSLACAHAEFADEARRDGNAALVLTEVGEVARWGAPSANTAVAQAAVHLRDAFDSATAKAQIDAFLGLCAENGHII